MPEAAWPHRERIAVRYHEVDLQNVVFNAHYLAYCDIACASWMRDAIGWTGTDDPVDWMLVKVVVEWQGSATYGDLLDVDCGIARWGTSSFDVASARSTTGRCSLTITYVCVPPQGLCRLAAGAPPRQPRAGARSLG